MQGPLIGSPTNTICGGGKVITWVKAMLLFQKEGGNDGQGKTMVVYYQYDI